VLAALSYLARDHQQSLQLGGDVGMLKIRFDALDKFLVNVQMSSGNRAKRGLAGAAAVELGNTGSC
jgi:hypothetical protein